MDVRSPDTTHLDLPEQRIARRLAAGASVVLFDGVCALCNGAVDFILRRDPRGRFAFAPLQSEEARAYLQKRGKALTHPLDTLVLIDEEGIHERSTAALRILRGLSGGWPLFYLFAALPEVLRDGVYNTIAANRYRWFGTRATCRVPTATERARFV